MLYHYNLNLQDMTREEQINKEAYRQEGLVDMDVESFIAGAKWADANPKSSWISVEDDLPCNHEDMVNVFVEHVELRTDCVLTMSDEGYISIDYMKKLGPWPWHWSGIEKTTHWIPIPKLLKEQEVNL